MGDSEPKDENETVTLEQVREKMAAWKAKAAMVKMEGSKPGDEANGMALKKLKQLAAKGEITPEQVRAKLMAWKKNMGDSEPKDENETITLEQVREKMAA